MKFHSRIISSIALTSILLVGCTSEPTPKEPTAKVEALSIENLPLEINELIAEQKSNKAVNFSDLTDKEKEKFLKDVYKKDLKELYLNLYNAFKIDYEKPDEVMNKLTYDAGEFDTNGKYMFKENLNVVFVLDASGSMGKLIDGNTQMQIAKSAINNFLKSLPKEANVALRVYGHKGKGTEEEKELSCKSSDAVYKLSKYNESEFQSALNTINPSGWTPTELALKETLQDIKDKKADTNTNIIYLISDGISTCNDNPIEAAKTLVESDSKPVINVIGFNVDADAKKQLEDITEVSKGTYKDVSNANELTNEFREVEKVAKEWKEWLASKDEEFQTNNRLSTLEIFNYAARLQQTSTEIQNNISTALKELKDNEKISEKDYEVLMLTNENYFNSLTDKFAEFKTELRDINTENYTKALKEIEDLLYGE